MVPFADCVNHANVDTGFDCVDEKGDSYDDKKPEEEVVDNEKARSRAFETRNAIFGLKTDLLDLEVKMRGKLEAKGMTTQTEGQKSE